MSRIIHKSSASAIHLAISLVVVLPFSLFVYFVLYTPPILYLEGGDGLALVILGVNLLLGPTLTFVLYRKGKPGLVLDLALVAAVQVAAFAYGAWTLYSQRPLYLAYIVEHFEIMPASAIDTGQLEDKTLAPTCFRGPQPVFVQKPVSGRERLKITLDAARGGRDFHFYPKFYRPLTEHLDQLRKHAWTLERLREENRLEAVETVERHLRQLGRNGSEVLISPIHGYSREGTVLLDPASGDILDYLDVEIW